MTVSPAAATYLPAAVAEVAEVEETGEIPTAVDGTPGKTIKDFLKSFSFEQGTGKAYATMVKGKWWKLYCEANSIEDTSPPVLVTTDADGKVTGIETTLVRKVLQFMEQKVKANETTELNYKKMVKSYTHDNQDL